MTCASENYSQFPVSPRRSPRLRSAIASGTNHESPQPNDDEAFQPATPPVLNGQERVGFIEKLYDLVDENKVAQWSQDGRSFGIPNTKSFMALQNICNSSIPLAEPKWSTVHRQLTAYGFVKFGREVRNHKETDAHPKFRHPNFYRGCPREDLRRPKAAWKTWGNGAGPTPSSNQLVSSDCIGDFERRFAQQENEIRNLKQVSELNATEIRDLKQEVIELKANQETFSKRIHDCINYLVAHIKGVLFSGFTSVTAEEMSDEVERLMNGQAPQPDSVTPHVSDPVSQTQTRNTQTLHQPTAHGTAAIASSPYGLPSEMRPVMPERNFGFAGVQPMQSPSQASSSQTQGYLGQYF